MDERRKYFRLKNHGEINASLDNNPIEIVEISSNGAVVVKQKTDIPKGGMLKLQIHNFIMELCYEVIRAEDSNIVLHFTKEDETDKLFLVLKRLRDERKK
ncbi:TPA: PilZ domain-containing protein [Legionella pneumophila]|uniref:Lpg0364 family Dot/Icm type IV secretion system effector n=1 Tax=Legionella sp. PATHC039 TaxID=2992042 RepID=UPI00077888FD|nr:MULTISPECIES: Lpg0364 family Dot/Icm type IV secretion system effector [Legionella]HAT8858582.1 PilZ domain-containing protein [Legionella pneumophila subsp. pneumophila]MCW8396000.1 Lpg0364 family Dot/Icm type IV secretion system effector [Legionella sp. PATHC039]HAT7074022.1 PilZ domain-containing protein [Legionella pneumophila]HAT8642902.1 PilZ domain-containing protein [Legionella pneumophila]HAT8869328.1 PilZ domain-containing protein [Legionella pneumophila subsp. pneumophila]